MIDDVIASSHNPIMSSRPRVHAAVQRKTRVASAPSLAGAHRQRGQQVMLLSLDEDSRAE